MTMLDRPLLAEQEAATYAGWFACLAEPARVKLLHTVATASGEITVGELTHLPGVSQSPCSHHIRKLAEVGFVRSRKEGTAGVWRDTVFVERRNQTV
ncbi:hypothetical protein KIPE111705_27555 [Kibdelosporangium persicum]|uniref:HTH-type transcriptional repressor CzrA n=1 Tax=Kibdelosporangium persicum TaxID=2698649 RepID=A0ABX2FI10_9PSEU|nr:HTH-type transcriptional repressor CzrA [Kibdelosporangium persicum]